MGYTSMRRPVQRSSVTDVECRTLCVSGAARSVWQHRGVGVDQTAEIRLIK